MKSLRNIILLLFVIIGFFEINYANSEVSLNDAINIGKVELCKKNKSFCNVIFESIEADEGNTVWNKSILTNPQLLEPDFIKQMELDKKSFWAILYVKKHESKIVNGKIAETIGGGGAVVFIERKTGKLIGFAFDL